MHDRLNTILLQEAHAGRRFVLVIDEAQNLDDSVLETARLLSDFETPGEKLMQIVFAGQPQLAEKLNRHDLVQLRQRISVLGRLRSFNASEVRQYIAHRLQVAGHDGGTLFTRAALEAIAVRSEGIPRNINNLCFQALTLGYSVGRREIDVDMIEEVASDLELNLPLYSQPGAFAPLPSPAQPRSEALNTAQVASSTPIIEPVRTHVAQAEPNRQAEPIRSSSGNEDFVLEFMDDAQERGGHWRRRQVTARRAVSRPGAPWPGS